MITSRPFPGAGVSRRPRGGAESPTLRAAERERVDTDAAFGDRHGGAGLEFIRGLFDGPENECGGRVVFEAFNAQADDRRPRRVRICEQLVKVAVERDDDATAFGRGRDDFRVVGPGHAQLAHVIGFVTGFAEQPRNGARQPLIDEESHDAGLNSMMRSSSVAAA